MGVNNYVREKKLVSEKPVRDKVCTIPTFKYWQYTVNFISFIPTRLFNNTNRAFWE